jgi:hypothetical protein
MNILTVLDSVIERMYRSGQCCAELHDTRCLGKSDLSSGIARGGVARRSQRWGLEARRCVHWQSWMR